MPLQNNYIYCGRFNFNQKRTIMNTKTYSTASEIPQMLKKEANGTYRVSYENKICMFAIENEVEGLVISNCRRFREDSSFSSLSDDFSWVCKPVLIEEVNFFI